MGRDRSRGANEGCVRHILSPFQVIFPTPPHPRVLTFPRVIPKLPRVLTPLNLLLLHPLRDHPPPSPQNRPQTVSILKPDNKSLE